MKTLCLSVAILLFTCFAAWAAPSLRDSNLVVTEIAAGLSTPTTMAFIGADDILVLQKNDGKVFRVISGQVQSSPVLDVNVDNASERGLLGIAIHPNFPTTPFVYLYFTESSAGTDTTGSPAANRVYRYTWNGSTLVSRTLILDLPATPGPNHDGGMITFGPDGKLYVVIGDLNRNGQLQNIPAGPAPDNTSVIFRLNDDGSTPTDNPFFGQGGNVARYYAYGIRNSFGLAFDPLTAKLWMTENGPDSYDEINLVEPGFNSGWKQILGPDSRDPNNVADLFQLPGSHYSDPKFSWLNTVAPTGIVFLSSVALGASYQFDAFVGDVNNGNLYHFKPNATRDGFLFTGAGLSDLVADNAGEMDELILGQGFNGITDLKVGPDGRLYVVSILDGKIYAISSRNNPPDTTPPQTNITSGPAGTITVNGATFSWTGSDNVTPTANLLYSHRLDPIESSFTPFSGAIVTSYSNLANGNYTFLVKAKDQAGNEDPTPASQSFVVNAAGGTPTLNLAFDGMLRDRVGQGDQALASDGKLDGVFTVTLNPGSGNRTITGLQLTNVPGGIWNTLSPDQFWSLGVASGLDTSLLNGPNDSVNFALSEGSTVKIFAADFEDRMYLNGTIFTLTVNFADGSTAGATTTVSSISAPSIALAFDGQIRDRVGQGDQALAPDGKLDGVFTVTLNPGSGSRTITRFQLTNVPGGIWNTQAPDQFWSLGVASGLDTALLNGANDSVNVALTEGSTVKIFAADFEDRMYLNGTTFTLTVNFSDGSTATAATTVNLGTGPSIALAFDGQIRDRVGQGDQALAFDGKPDGVFTMTLNPGSGNRTITRLQLTNVSGGVWDTQAPDQFWSLGVASALDGSLLNMAGDSVNFSINEGSSVKLFAADFENRMYLSGTVFTLAATFADGSTATQSVTVP